MFIPFGDSHSVFWGNQQNYDTPHSNIADTPKLYWLGPAKIYGLENSTVNNTKDKFKHFQILMASFSDDTPIACFGEIDIRVNISKIILENGSFTSIENIVTSYLNNLNTLPNNQIIIWGPPPASMVEVGKVSQDYPIYGDGITRNSIIHLFNLEILKKINDYPRLKFITLFYDLIDINLITNSNALHDANHLSIVHYPHARNLLEIVTSGINKVAFNIEIFKKIKFPHFNCRPLQHQSQSYITNNIFHGNMNFKFFTNLKFDQKNINN